MDGMEDQDNEVRIDPTLKPFFVSLWLGLNIGSFCVHSIWVILDWHFSL